MFIFTAKQGKQDFGSDFNEARFREELKKNEGKRYRIDKVENKRTLTQNSFYWFYLGIIERETGNTANDLHEYFKRIFLPPKYIKVLGKEIKIPSSTTDLKKLEFGEYMEKICAETNVPIPDPKEAGYDDGKGMIKREVEELYKQIETPEGEVKF